MNDSMRWLVPYRMIVSRRDLLTALLAGMVGSLGVGDLLAKRRTPDRAGIHTARKKKHKKKHKKKGEK